MDQGAVHGSPAQSRCLGRCLLQRWGTVSSIIAESLCLLDYLRYDPRLVHFLPQVGGLRRRFAGYLSAPLAAIAVLLDVEAGRLVL